ncbi:MAG: Threonine 3-dehydrogenase [Parcubacteria group bacterium GW2011_GWA2_52_8]|nr:MAG: Threonine 3-dehydrogenase [Parcubacteria group bacterium GW2011_GWA2_52_8]
MDVSFEMAGFNSSFNNALMATRRGGNVILFGIKTGDFILQDYNRLIVRGLTLHAVIGRQIWKTWETTRKLMESIDNGIQEKIFNIILNRGEGTILPIAEYSKERFEKMMAEHPKFLIQF